jgi:hypothetical protein
MPDLVQQLRESRKSPSVLKHRLISVRSVRPDVLVFIFEGLEDVGIYETWIARTQARPTYEAIPGNGKEQLLGLRDHLLTADPKLLYRVHFFVDCDFDPYNDPDDHLFTLDAYSAENYLCSSESLESILADEFRCAGSPMERQRIIQKFEQVREEFKQHAKQVNLGLFLARRHGIKVIRKPEDACEIAKIQLESIICAYNDVGEVLELASEIEQSVVQELEEEFRDLSALRAQRGKYVLSMFLHWLKALAADRRRELPSLFDHALSLPGEPWKLQLRRLASLSPLPQGLDQFVANAARAA